MYINEKRPRSPKVQIGGESESILVEPSAPVQDALGRMSETGTRLLLFDVQPQLRAADRGALNDVRRPAAGRRSRRDGAASSSRGPRSSSR